MGLEIERTDTRTQSQYQTETQQTDRLPLLSDYVRLDLLNMTTKGVFPDTVPDAKYLKDLIENFADRDGVVLTRSANPAVINRPHI